MATALFVCSSGAPLSALACMAAERHGGRFRVASLSLSGAPLHPTARRVLEQRGYAPPQEAPPPEAPDVVIALGAPAPTIPESILRERPIVANWPAPDPAEGGDASAFRRALRLAERRARLLAELPECEEDPKQFKRALRAIASATVEDWVAEDFLADAPALRPSDPCATADLLFRAEPSLGALPVIEDGVGAGVLSRGALYAMAAQAPTGRWATMPVSEAMNHAPAQADCDATLEEIAELLARGEGASPADGFLLLRDGRCIGLGDGVALLRRLYAEAGAKQRALRASERRFREIVDMAGDSFWEVDAQNRFTFLSQRFADQPGLDPASAIGHSIEHLAKFGVAVERFEALLAARKGYRNLVHRIVLPDGSIRHWRSSGMPLFDENGAYAGFHGATTDVTALVEAAEAAEGRARDVARSESRFRDIAGVAADWFWERDAAFRLTCLSERFQHVTGIAPVDVLGRTLEELGLLIEPQDVAAVTAAERERTPFRDVTYRVRLSDGRLRYWRTSGAPVFDEGGSLVGWRGSGNDVTEAREAEAALRAAKEMAEAASRAKSHFLANMSHELRTPLNAVIGFAELLQSEAFGPLQEKQREYLADIENSGRHLLTLINDILELVKFEASELALKESEILLEEAIEKARRMTTPAAAKGGVRLAVELDRTIGPVLADERRIQQILINLLSNAVKFTPAGGRIVLRTRLEPDGGASVSVIDEGVGMTPEQVSRAGEPFWQAEAGLARSYEGTGLGLAIVKRLAAAHDARFELESELGRGATATLRLPPERVVQSARRARLRLVSG
jgi:PAS domain S-box-containing protein